MERVQSIWCPKAREWSRSAPAGRSISHIFGVRKRGAVRRSGHERARSSVWSAAAEVAQVDHRVGQSFEGIMHIGDELVANENTPEFVLQIGRASCRERV